MEIDKHQSCIEKYTNKLVPRIEETLLHKKPGYEFANESKQRCSGTKGPGKCEAAVQAQEQLFWATAVDHDDGGGH